MHLELRAERILIQQPRTSAVTRECMNTPVPLWKIPHLKKKNLEKVRKDSELVGAEAGKKSTEFERGDLRLVKLHLTA